MSFTTIESASLHGIQAYSAAEWRLGTDDNKPLRKTYNQTLQVDAEVKEGLGILTSSGRSDNSVRILSSKAARETITIKTSINRPAYFKFCNAIKVH